jgi:hypothetical protein
MEVAKPGDCGRPFWMPNVFGTLGRLLIYATILYSSIFRMWPDPYNPWQELAVLLVSGGAYCALMTWEVQVQGKRGQREARWGGFFFTAGVTLMWTIALASPHFHLHDESPLSLFGLVVSHVVFAIAAGCVGMLAAAVLGDWLDPRRRKAIEKS